MGYQRKQEDNRRMRKVTMEVTGGWPAGAYYRERDGQRKYLKRYWKSQGKNSCWAYNKRYSHRYIRRKYKDKDYSVPVYKAYDLWWNVW